MKISNETKVGALTALAITLFILGFNFLKGKSLFKTGKFVYAKFENTNGLMVSNPVFIHGYQVGNVYELEQSGKVIENIIVSIKLTKDILIPENSIAVVKSNPLGTPSIDITLGDAKTYLKNNDTIRTKESSGLMGELETKLSPVVNQVESTLHSLDTLLVNINTVFDPRTKNNLQDVVQNARSLTASLVVSSAHLQSLLNTQTGALAKSLDNMNSFTGNLAKNNEKISSTMSNLEKTTAQLSRADIEGMIKQLNATVDALNATVGKINSKDGSLGMLINDKKLYDNIANSTRSLNVLLDDLRVNPKRYVNISVFGKKDKGGYLVSPLPAPDSTVIQ